MSNSSAARWALVVAATLCTAVLDASTPKFFLSATQADFLKGEIDSLSIDNRGQLTLGPATELIYETPSPFLWAVTPASDGALFIGTGNDGRVYRVDAQGAGRLFFDATELEIHAMAPAPDGGLYVATSPDGRIYKVDRNGTSTTFFDPEEKYIWALASDPSGTLYAGTGEKGVVYRITADGRGSAFYQTRATHATAIALDRGGNIIVGTESPGRVFRVDPQGKAFLLLDTPFQEIRTLRFDDQGTLFAAAVSGRPSSGTPAIPTVDAGTAPAANANREPVPTVTVSTEVTAIVSDGGSTGAPTTSRVDARSAKGGVYRIAPDGLWDLLWESRDDLPYDVGFDSERRLVIGTGGKGKIYRLEGTPLQPTLIARAAAQQVTALFADARGRLYYATANPGKLFRLSPGRAARGTYESEVRDAQMVSSWGAISWRGSFPSSSRVEISTRSGNVEVPDDTWSEWSSPYANAEGSPISSPKARYLQWKATLSGSSEGPILTSVNVAYLQRNLRPQVRSVTVHPPGIVFQKPFSTGDPDLAGFETQTTPDRKLVQAAQNSGQSGSPSLGRRTYQKGLETIVWRAEDENDDELSYSVQYRREGETAWRTLREGLTDPILVWDTTTVPNGTYFVKVVASDAPSNPVATALTGDLESAVFEIDNLPPSIVSPQARVDGTRTIISFEVRDEHSTVQKVEMSEDGLVWRVVFSADAMADSRRERYELTLDHVLSGRGVTVRATDAMNNVATAQIELSRTR